MADQTKTVISAKVPLWFRREIGVRAAKRDETISDCVYRLLKLALRRDDWLTREVARRSAPQLEFPPILQETREG
ncbi:hypothetical protein ES703_125743 [subsurface metagenome]